MHAAEHHGVRAVGVTLSQPAGRPGREAGGRGRAVRPRSRSASRTTATSPTGRSTPSARSACSSTSARPASASTSAACTSSSSARSGRLLNHGISRPSGAAGPPARTQLHRPLRVPRRRAARGRPGRVAVQQSGFEVRHVESAARALRPHAAAVGGQPRGRTGTRRSRTSARPAPGCGASTWPARRSTSRPGARSSTRCWPCPPPTTAARGCPYARCSSDWLSGLCLARDGSRGNGVRPPHVIASRAAQRQPKPRDVPGDRRAGAGGL